MGMDDYEGMWPKDGEYAETSIAEIARDLFHAGKITIEEVIEFIARDPLDITKAFEGALLMADMDEPFKHVHMVHAIWMPGGEIGVGVQVCDHYRLDENLSEQERGFWQLAIYAALKAHGFEVREHDGKMQVRIPEREGGLAGLWKNIAEAQVTTFVEELDKELGPSYEPARKWWGK